MTSPVIKERPPVGAATIAEILRRVLADAADRALQQALLDILRIAASASAEETAQALGLRPSVDAGHPTIARLASDRLSRIVGVNDETRRRVASALLDVLTQGGSLERQQAAVRDVFAASRARGQTVARTETGIYWHAAGRQQALDLGARSHTWLSTRDLRVRDSHAIADGQCQPIGQPFYVGGYPLMHPSDPNGPPGEVINCRCTEIHNPTTCEGRSLSFERRTMLWKAKRRAIAPYERLAGLVIRRQMSAQREGIIFWLARLSGSG